MIIGVPRETSPGENRVALVPDIAKKLHAKKIDVLIEKSAGLAAGYSDQEYLNAGAKIRETKADIFGESEIVCSLNGPKIFDNDAAQATKISDGLLYVSFLNPLVNAQRMKRIAEANVTAFAMELIPRISRAQAMDALSSQANLAGYKAVILAANSLKKVMPMFMTAAGTISPAKVLVLGAGVAGLQAIATAKRLGAVVYAYDIRDAVKEQIESLGGKFVKIRLEESGEGEGGYAKALGQDTAAQQRKKLGEFASKMDVIISTAQIPGAKAPLLLEADAVAAMKPGSVIVDLAAGSGGNIEGSKPDETVEFHGVKIMGPTNLPSQLAYHASSMYAHNIASFLDIVVKDGKLSLDFEDEIVKGSCVTHHGEVVNDRVRQLLKH